MKQFIVYLIVGFCSILGAIGQICFSKASGDINISKPFEIITNYSLVTGLVCYGMSMVLYILVLKHGEVSILYPIIALSYVWVMFMSVWFLGEHLTTFKSLGVFLIIIGVVCIVR